MAQYYNPTVLDMGYGKGLAEGASNFGAYAAKGIQQKRDDATQQQQWQRQDARDEKVWAREDQRQSQQWARADSKELASKQDEADFAAAAWGEIKRRMPEMITPEMDDKFVSGSLGTKRALFTQAQTAAARQMKIDEEEARRFDPRSAQAYPIPGADGMGMVYDNKGKGGMMVRIPEPDYMRYAAPAQNETPVDIWAGQSPNFNEIPASPAYFSQMPDAPARMPAPAAAPQGAAIPAPAQPGARTPESYFGF